jgi:hypothetical protein
MLKSGLYSDNHTSGKAGKDWRFHEEDIGGIKSFEKELSYLFPNLSAFIRLSSYVFAEEDGVVLDVDSQLASEVVFEECFKAFVVVLVALDTFLGEDAGNFIVRSFNSEVLITNVEAGMVSIEHGFVIGAHKGVRHEEGSVVTAVADSRAGGADVHHQ